MASIDGSSPSCEGDDEVLLTTTTPLPPSVASKVAGNEDLLTSILLRLPAKPLVRFKSISKHWLSLISDPCFSLLHTLQNPNPKPSGLVFSPKPVNEIKYEFASFNGDSFLSESPPFKSLDFVHDPLDIHILQSCKGLLLCSSFCRSFEQLTTERYYVYNPTTNRFSVIEPPGDRSRDLFSSIHTRMSLAFDPSKSPHYKVVLVRNVIGQNQYFQIHIYSSETRSWKFCGYDFEWPSFLMFCQGVYWNGAIHWGSKKEGSMCFDVDLQCHKKMPLFPVFRGWDEASIRYLGESGDHLYLVDVQGLPVTEIDVYEMERDYSQWSPKHRIHLNQLVAAYPDMVSSVDDALSYYSFSVICLVRAETQENEEEEEEEEEESISLVLHVPGKVISYNFKEKSIKQLRDHLPGEVDKNPVYRLRCFDGFLYFQTLACV